MFAEIFSASVFITLLLALSTFINIVMAIVMAYKLHVNHMKYHVFRPILAGVTVFVSTNAILSLFITLVWQTSYIGNINILLCITLLLLAGSLSLFSAVMYSAKHIFEKIEVPEIIEEKEETNDI